MSYKALSKLTPEEKQEFKEYLEFHEQSGAIAQTFPGIQSHMPPKWVCLVTTTLVILGPYLELIILPMKTPRLPLTETKSVWCYFGPRALSWMLIHSKSSFNIST